ncbi:ACP S-malonyltransferase [Sediminivirga luteola]|uniref:ACP S-malonyltransferase n=1 Tax=Sediminivirga luteola TaxID=1774748 RepID=UPI001F5A2698|nr:ACP S-malonyltransferase [Sediminivirga luteola]
MLAIVCPGQGAQKSGFLSAWLELPGFRERFERLAAHSGADLIAHGTVSDDETIKDTAVAQPLLVAAAIATFAELFPAGGAARPDVLAGHSVGEIGAAQAAGVLDEEQAMRFVALRGSGMARAAAAEPTGMSAVVGGDPAQVRGVIEAHGLSPANVNGAAQTVAAGALDRLAALAENPPERARVIPLPVAGAFHTAYMAPAQDDLAAYARQLQVSDPAVTLLSNADGKPVRSGTDVLSSLVSQVTRPVRWDLCQAELASLGVTGLLELPPAGTLVGLAKRELKGVETFALRSPDDLDAATEFIATHRKQAAA